MKWLCLALSLACASGSAAEQPIDREFLRELEQRAKALTNNPAPNTNPAVSPPRTERSFFGGKNRVAPLPVQVAVPPAEKLLPADTLGFFTVPDWAKGQAAYSNSAMGQLWADPAMKAFKEKFFEK